MDIDKKVGIITSVLGIGMVIAHFKNADFNILLLFSLAIILVILIANTNRIRKLEKLIDTLKENP